MKLAMDFHIQGDAALVAAVAFDDWAASEGTKHYALPIAHVEKPVKGEPDLRALPWLLQLIAANRLQPEAIVIDGFVHLDAQETPGLGRRLHDALGGRVPVIGIARSTFKGADTPAQFELHREEEAAPLIVTCAGIDLGAAKARVRAMHGRKRVPTLMKLAARVARGAATSP